mgnify:CR=1
MILITGSTGYIGSHLSYYFQKKKIDIVIHAAAFSYVLEAKKEKKIFC